MKGFLDFYILMHISRNVFCLVFFGILLSGVFLSIDKVHAQSVGIKISPVKVEEIVEPGQIFEGKLKVTNESNIDKKFFVYLKDFKAGDENGSPVIIAPGSEEGYYLASWIDITSVGIDFKAGEEKLIPYSVKIPDDAGPGGYFGGVYFGTEPPKLSLDGGDQGAGMSVAQQAGCLLLLRVKGEVYEEAFIREFTTDKKYYSAPFDVNFSVRVENKGNVHIKPYGAIRITDMFGREKKSVMINSERGNVLPKSIRRFTGDWGGKYGFGKYTVELGLTYGQSEKSGGQGMQSMVAYQSFWIIPWKIIGPFLIAILVLLTVFILTVKIYKDKAVKSAMRRAGVEHVKTIKNEQKGDSPLAHVLLILTVVMIVLFLIFMSVYFLFFA
jgi:hypothetical protein